MTPCPAHTSADSPGTQHQAPTSWELLCSIPEALSCSSGAGGSCFLSVSHPASPILARTSWDILSPLSLNVGALRGGIVHPVTDPARCHHHITSSGCSSSSTASPAPGENPCSSSSGQCEVAQGTVLCPCAPAGMAQGAGEQGWLWRAVPMVLPPAHPEFLEE